MTQESLNNDFKLTRLILLSRCVRNLKPCRMNAEKSFVKPSDTQQRYNKYLTNLFFLLTHCKLRILVFSTLIYGPRASRMGHKLMEEKLDP